MSQPDQRGNFVAYMNRSKQPGDKKPAFDGRIAIPGSDTERRFALWTYDYTDPKTGEQKLMFNGKTDTVAFTDTPNAQIAQLARTSEQSVMTQGNLDLAAGQIVMFPNDYQNEQPENDRPDYYGYFNPGDGSPVVRIGAWLTKDRYQHAMMSGATSYPRPNLTERDQQDAEGELQQLLDTGAVRKGFASSGQTSEQDNMER